MGSGITKGGRDFYEWGAWNLMCAYCGRKRKNTEVLRDDQFARGLWCCPDHRDLRHPQEFARGIKEDMNVPFVQPPIMKFVQLNIDFPIGIFPPLPLITLVLGSLFITTESFQLITTESGLALVTETGERIAVVIVILPPWVSPVQDPFGIYVTSVLWSWESGGVGITIDSPTSLETFLTTTLSSASGVLQVQVTNSLGEVGTASVNVST
jgi:hypothetical protein